MPTHYPCTLTYSNTHHTHYITHHTNTHHTTLTWSRYSWHLHCPQTTPHSLGPDFMASPLPTYHTTPHSLGPDIHGISTVFGIHVEISQSMETLRGHGLSDLPPYSSHHTTSHHTPSHHTLHPGL